MPELPLERLARAVDAHEEAVKATKTTRQARRRIDAAHIANLSAEKDTRVERDRCVVEVAKAHPDMTQTELASEIRRVRSDVSAILKRAGISRS